MNKTLATFMDRTIEFIKGQRNRYDHEELVRQFAMKLAAGARVAEQITICAGPGHSESEIEQMASTAATDLENAIKNLNQSFEAMQGSFLTDELEDFAIRPDKETSEDQRPMRYTFLTLTSSENGFLHRTPLIMTTLEQYVCIKCATQHSGAPSKRFSGNHTSF